MDRLNETSPPIGQMFGEYTVTPEQAVRLPSGLEIAAGIVRGVHSPNLVVMAGIDHNWHNPAHPTFTDVERTFEAFCHYTEGQPRVAIHEGRNIMLPEGITKQMAFEHEGRAEVGLLAWLARERGIKVLSAEPPMQLAFASLLSPNCHNFDLDALALYLWMRQQAQARIAGMAYDAYIQKTVVDAIQFTLERLHPDDVANLQPDVFSSDFGTTDLPFRLICDPFLMPPSVEAHHWGFRHTPQSLIALYEKTYSQRFGLSDADIAFFTSQTTGHMFGVRDIYPNGIARQVAIAHNDDRDMWHFTNLRTLSQYSSAIDLTGGPHMRWLTPAFNTSASVVRTLFDSHPGPHSFQLGPYSDDGGICGSYNNHGVPFISAYAR